MDSFNAQILRLHRCDMPFPPGPGEERPGLFSRQSRTPCCKLQDFTNHI